MPDNKVIIIDETKDDAEELTPEELEERSRKERLAKLINIKHRKHDSIYLKLCKIGCIVGLFGIMLSMLLVSGVALVVSLILLLVCGSINYIFYK